MTTPTQYRDELAEKTRTDKERRRRLKEMASILTRLYTTLAQRKVTVVLGNDANTHTPGWTTGSAITLNLPYLPGMTTNDDTIVMYGLGYHELAHVLFTPTVQQLMADRSDHSLYSVVFGSDALPSAPRAFNILEDQRIETMLVAMYLSTRNYLKATILRYNVPDAQAAEVALPFIHGRKYLPQEIRKAVWDLSSLPVRVRREFASIIDAYRVLDLFTETGTRTAARLVKRFAELMDQNQMGNADGCGAPADQYGSKEAPQGAARIVQRVKSGVSDAKGNQATEKAMSKGPSKPANGTDKGNGGSGKGKGGKSASGDSDGLDSEGGTDGEGEADETADQATSTGEESETDSDSAGQGGNGSDDETDADEGDAESVAGKTGKANTTAGSGGPAPTFTAKQLTALIEEAAYDINRSPEVRANVRKFNASIGINWIEGLGRDVPRVRVIMATDDEMGELNSLRRRIVQSLRRVEEDSDPYWETHVNAGRPNIARIMRDPRDFDTNFDRWVDAGDSGADMETVFMVDVSQSMEGNEVRLSRAAWVMKSASDQLHMPATTIAFSNGHTIVYGAKDRAEQNRVPGIVCAGGTKPASAMQTAINVLARSRKRSRLLVIMTDGDWVLGSVTIGKTAMSEDTAIKVMGEAGILVCLVNFGSAARLRHNAQIVEHINDVSALPALYERVLVRQLTQANQRRR